MANRRPSAPAHLTAATRAWWSSVIEEFALEGHHVKLLTLAAESWDRAQEARATIKAAGPYFDDRFGQPKAHPALAVERDSRISFARLLRELDLDAEAPDALPPARRRR